MSRLSEGKNTSSNKTLEFLIYARLANFSVYHVKKNQQKKFLLLILEEKSTTTIRDVKTLHLFIE